MSGRRISVYDRARRLERRAEISHLALQQVPVTEIAERHDISVQSVYYNLRKAREAWQDDTKRDTGYHLAVLIAELRSLQLQYQEAYDRSCRPKTRTRLVRKTKFVARKIDAGPAIPLTLLVPGTVSPSPMSQTVREEVPDGTEEITETEPRDGDPRFLDGIGWCKKEIAKMLALYPKESTAPKAPMQLVIIREASPALLPEHQDVTVATPPPIPIDALLPPTLTFADPEADHDAPPADAPPAGHEHGGPAETGGGGGIGEIPV